MNERINNELLLMSTLMHQLYDECQKSNVALHNATGDIVTNSVFGAYVNKRWDDYRVYFGDSNKDMFFTAMGEAFVMGARYQKERYGKANDKP